MSQGNYKINLFILTSKENNGSSAFKLICTTKANYSFL